MIAARGLEHRSFYIVNAIWVKGRAEDVLALAERPEVARVEGNLKVRNYPNPLPALPAPEPDPDAPATVEQGIAYTNAPAGWRWGSPARRFPIGSRCDQAALPGVEREHRRP